MGLIVYGATCTWWDEKEKAVVPPGRSIPGCPHCQSVLFEQDKAVWLRQIEEHDRRNPGYKDFMLWLKGKCHPNLKNAQFEYSIYKEAKQWEEKAEKKKNEDD